jgi:hypothetical protein
VFSRKLGVKLICDNMPTILWKTNNVRVLQAANTVSNGATASRVGCAVQNGCADYTDMLGCAYSAETILGVSEQWPAEAINTQIISEVLLRISSTPP